MVITELAVIHQLLIPHGCHPEPQAKDLLLFFVMSELAVIRPEPGDRGMFHGRLNWKLNGIHRHLSEMA
jgi:hypothetical protein